MSKLTKGCIIAALIFILLGFIMVVSAFAVGGVDGIIDMVRNGDLVYYANNDSDFWFDDDYDDEYEHLLSSGEEVSIDNLAGADEIKNLTIEAGGRELIIQITDDANFSIECKDSKRLRCYVEGNELIILDQRRYRNNNDWKNREMYLNIPKSVRLSELSIEIGAGMVIADQLAADEVSVNVGAGQIVITEISARDASFHVGAGEIMIDSGTIQDAEMSVAAGRIDFEGIIQGDLDAECNVGQIGMLLSGKEEDHNYEVDSSMGNISIGGNSMSGFAEKRMMNNDAASDFELSCSMGNINIDFEE